MRRRSRMAAAGTQRPDRDFQEIYRRVALVDFAWEVKLGFNLAFYRSFTVPSIGGLLAATGELTERTQKRADDTGLLMYEIIYHGFNHPRGREAVRRLNRIHRRYAISNDDYRYVLGSFVIVPTRWIDRYGRRLLTPDERQATFLFYRELGRRMAIADIPDSYEGLVRFFDDYERHHFAGHPAGPVLIAVTRRLLADRFPRWMRPAVLAAGDVLLDEPLRRALQVPEPPRAVRGAVQLLLRARSWALRLAPAPRELAFHPGQPTQTYPDGYTIADLGPPNPLPERHDSQ